MWVLVAAAIWTLALTVWLPTLVLLLSHRRGHLEAGNVGILGSTVAVVVVATAIVGFLVGLTTQLRWIWFAAAAGTATQQAGYVASMLMVPQPGGAEGHAVAVGLIIFSPPILVAVTGLLWVGAGIGWLARWARRRMRSRVAGRTEGR